MHSKTVHSNLISVSLHLCGKYIFFTLSITFWKFFLLKSLVFRYIKKCARIEKGAQNPGHEIAGTIHVKHVYEIAKEKKKEPFNEYIGLREICRMIVSTSKSMGIQVISARNL